MDYNTKHSGVLIVILFDDSELLGLLKGFTYPFEEEIIFYHHH